MKNWKKASAAILAAGLITTSAGQVWANETVKDSTDVEAVQVTPVTAEDLENASLVPTGYTANNIFALSKNIEKISNPTAKAALQKNIDKALAKWAEKNAETPEVPEVELPETPEAELPETPETEVPETEVETPEVETPETDVETPEVEVPETEVETPEVEDENELNEKAAVALAKAEEKKAKALAKAEAAKAKAEEKKAAALAKAEAAKAKAEEKKAAALAKAEEKKAAASEKAAKAKNGKE
ncbi:hypothetical protein [Paenisporosarcina sp.]|uniref:hypothetical protein n=1 Tax=Paenisporosarcina sp. TaxID=1932001 RepID=UPI003C73A63F